MSDKLYAFISEEFDNDNFTGLLMAAESAEDADGFTEQGYDTEYVSLVEVTPKATKYASEEDVLAAMEAAGLRVYGTYDDYERETGLDNWDDVDVFVLEHKGMSEFLETQSVQKVLEAAGFDAARDYVMVTNYQVLFSMFWRRDTFDISEPVPVPSSIVNQ